MNLNIKTNLTTPKRNRWVKWMGIIFTVIFFPIVVIFVLLVLFVIIVSG